LIRMRELAVQSNNGTYQSEDRQNANYEYTALKTEIKRIADVTAFNRLSLASTSAGVSRAFFVGSDVGQGGNTVSFTPGFLNLNNSGATTGIGGTFLDAIDTATSAAAAVGHLDTAITTLASRRAQAGALVNRFEHTVANLMNVSQRLQEAVSGIEDTDYAAESAALARGMVLQQAGTAMLAQANQQPQYILTLLK